MQKSTHNCMIVTDQLAATPEYQAWLRQLAIDHRHDILKQIEDKNEVPPECIRNLRHFMQEQRKLSIKLLLSP